jgi:hypothetical protein
MCGGLGHGCGVRSGILKFINYEIIPIHHKTFKQQYTEE